MDTLIQEKKEGLNLRLTENGKNLSGGQRQRISIARAMAKDCLLYTSALESVRRKKPHPLLDEVSFGVMEDGLSVQMMHIGSYDDETRSLEQMKNFIKENNLEITTLAHREIYITDARKAEVSKLKTVLRYRVHYK